MGKSKRAPISEDDVPPMPVDDDPDRAAKMAERRKMQERLREQNRPKRHRTDNRDGLSPYLLKLLLYLGLRASQDLDKSILIRYMETETRDISGLY